MKLLTISDGFGDSTAVPSWYPGFIKWPEIINFMTRGVELTNLSRYGAGNEYMLQCLRHNVQLFDVALIQWSIPNRLDLILQHPTDFWTDQISQDPVYKDNVVKIKNDSYWLSSASKNQWVLEYHQKYISRRQHLLRSQMFIEHATLLLESKGIDHGFLLSYDSDYLIESVKDFNRWHWQETFKGMHSFRKISKFADLDLGLTQPISLIQFDFIKQFIMPQLVLPWRSSKEIDAVENMLLRKYKEAVIAKPNDSN